MVVNPANGAGDVRYVYLPVGTEIVLFGLIDAIQHSCLSSYCVVAHVLRALKRVILSFRDSCSHIQCGLRRCTQV
jgi:hypothetical protein